jgi:hypothetical protein
MKKSYLTFNQLCTHYWITFFDPDQTRHIIPFEDQLFTASDRARKLKSCAEYLIEYQEQERQIKI